MQEVDRHESGEKRAKEGQDKQREELTGATRITSVRGRRQGAPVAPVLGVRDAVDSHTCPRARVLRHRAAHDYDKRSKHGKASLWWTLAEILAVVEGDGISPDSLLEVRLWKLREIKIYGATFARWRGDAGSSPLDRARTAASSPRND